MYKIVSQNSDQTILHDMEGLISAILRFEDRYVDVYGASSIPLPSHAEIDFVETKYANSDQPPVYILREELQLKSVIFSARRELPYLQRFVDIQAFTYCLRLGVNNLETPQYLRGYSAINILSGSDILLEISSISNPIMDDVQKKFVFEKLIDSLGVFIPEDSKFDECIYKLKQLLINILQKF